MLHSGAEEGGLVVSHLEPSELFGINRSVCLVEVPLRDLHSTERVCQMVLARLAASRVEDFECVDDVRAIDAVLAFRCGVEVCPQKVRLGVVGMMIPLVFRCVAASAPLCALETEGREDLRLHLLEGGRVAHVESTFRSYST